MSMDVIRSDFDRLAAFDKEGWSHNNAYQEQLLRHVPVNSGEGLDIGCGTGWFTRRLAERCRRVLGIDLSPEMIGAARSRSRGVPNVEFQAADVLEWPMPAEHYDVIASIATLHHLPLAEMLERMKQALKPGGVLLILDICRADNLIDFLPNLVAIPANLVMRLVKNGLRRPSREERQAWEEHGKHDHYPGISFVRRTCRELLPGAVVRHRLFWRYSVVWKKTA